MDKFIQIFNIVAGACSIAGFIISIFVVQKVYKISVNNNQSKRSSQFANKLDNGSVMAGGDVHDVTTNRK